MNTSCILSGEISSKSLVNLSAVVCSEVLQLSCFHLPFRSRGQIRSLLFPGLTVSAHCGYV